MADQALDRSRELAESVRFSEDRLWGHQPDDHTAADRVSSLSALNDLEISKAVTPDLARLLAETYSELSVPSHSVKTFVYASPEIQAECFSASSTECVLRFSSSLIDLLDEDEVRFVAGHELGHFLLSHGKSNSATEPESLEFYMQRRYQEISADRIGLLACQDLSTAVRTLIKITSGLSDKHIRFDVGAFLRQLRHVGKENYAAEIGATHPSVLVRARALLWFSMGRAFSREPGETSLEDIDNLDKRVKEDLERYVDKPAQRLLSDARDKVTLWVLAEKVTRRGVFRKEEQQVVIDLLDKEAMEGLSRFLSGLDSVTAAEEVGRRLSVAIQDLNALIPNRVAEELPKIQQLVDSSIS